MPVLSKKAASIRRLLLTRGATDIGVSLEVYTSSDMEQKRAAVKKLEAAVLRKPQPEAVSVKDRP